LSRIPFGHDLMSGPFARVESGPAGCDSAICDRRVAIGRRAGARQALPARRAARTSQVRAGDRLDFAIATDRRVQADRRFADGDWREPATTATAHER
jgi:hypothetical protein